MRTKEPRQTQVDYGLVSRLSIQRDFHEKGYKRIFGNRKESKPKSNIKRIIEMGDGCDYKQYRRYFVGKLVRIVSPANMGGNWVSFVHEKDKDALNNAAGWSNNKCQYLLYGVKYD